MFISKLRNQFLVFFPSEFHPLSKQILSIRIFSPSKWHRSEKTTMEKNLWIESQFFSLWDLVWCFFWIKLYVWKVVLPFVWEFLCSFVCLFARFGKKTKEIYLNKNEMKSDILYKFDLHYGVIFFVEYNMKNFDY